MTMQGKGRSSNACRGPARPEHQGNGWTHIHSKGSRSREGDQASVEGFQKTASD